MNPSMLDGGAILHVPPDGDDAPDLPTGAFALHPPPGSAKSSADSDCGAGFRRSNRWSYAPKRKAGKPDGPPPQRPRTDAQKAQDAGGEEFRARHQFPALAPAGFSVVSNRDLQHAIRFPIAGWPPRGVLVPTGERLRSRYHAAFGLALMRMFPN